MNETLFKKFEALTCRLSPENLTCDGECSRSEVNQRYQQIMREWRALEKEVGRAVMVEEIETESIRRYRANYPERC